MSNIRPKTRSVESLREQFEATMNAEADSIGSPYLNFSKDTQGYYTDVVVKTMWLGVQTGAYFIQADADVDAAVILLKRLKRDLMNARLHGPDLLRTYRSACTSAEGDIEEFLTDLTPNIALPVPPA